MSIELYKQITVRNPKGEIVSDTGLQPAHSFVKGFLQIIQMMWTNVEVPRCEMKSTQGVLFTITADTDWNITGIPFSLNIDTTTDEFGILVGNGVAAEDNEDWHLSNKITHGTGVDELEYGTSDYDTNYITVGAYLTWSAWRTFTNNSAAPVEVKEIGAACLQETTPEYALLILRDLLAPTVTVPIGNTMTVKYTIRTTA